MTHERKIKAARVHRTHAIIRGLLKGRALTGADVQDRFGVSKSQACKDLRVLQEIYDLETFWVEDSKYYAIDPDCPIYVATSCRA